VDLTQPGLSPPSAPNLGGDQPFVTPKIGGRGLNSYEIFIITLRKLYVAREGLSKKKQGLPGFQVTGVQLLCAKIRAETTLNTRSNKVYGVIREGL
jgi:hypothetical protein